MHLALCCFSPVELPCLNLLTAHSLLFPLFLLPRWSASCAAPALPDHSLYFPSGPWGARPVLVGVAAEGGGPPVARGRGRVGRLGQPP